MRRRQFLTGLASLIAAPAIVKAASLMPVRGIVMDSGLAPVIVDVDHDMNAVVFAVGSAAEWAKSAGFRVVSSWPTDGLIGAPN